MEYTDYWVVREDPASVRAKVAKVTDRGMVLDGEGGDLVFFVADGSSAIDDGGKLPKSFDWLLGVWDAEGGAWGFSLYAKGKHVASATYGENAEWGIDEDMNGFEGDVAETAKTLGASKKKLEACLDRDGVEKFCKAVGFEHQYTLYPRQLPDGVMLLSELM